MRFELFVALRYLFARKGRAFISIISWLSVAGVAIGVASLVIVMGVMNGFGTDLRNKIIGFTAHATVYSNQGKSLEDPELIRVLEQTPGITGATPFLRSGVLLSSYAGSEGLYLRGIDPRTAAKVLSELGKMTSGAVADLADESGLPGIIIGKSLAAALGLDVGSRVNLLAPAGQAGATGFTPTIRAFRVVGLFSVGIATYDMSFGFVSLSAARELLGWPDGLINGVEVAVDDVYAVDRIMRNALAAIGPQYHAVTWLDTNSEFFAALKLEKVAMAVILALVILVGSFSIVTALVMLVMEKTRDIAVLMSMGATKASIRKIFMAQGVVIGIIGTSLGFALGLGACFLLEQYKFIELPKGIYSLDYLPVLLDWRDMTLTGICAMFLCFVATLYPARQAASLEPAEALRHE